MMNNKIPVIVLEIAALFPVFNLVYMITYHHTGFDTRMTALPFVMAYCATILSRISHEYRWSLLRAYCVAFLLAVVMDRIALLLFGLSISLNPSMMIYTFGLSFLALALLSLIMCFVRIVLTGDPFILKQKK